LRPFPQDMGEDHKRRYREDMISNAGICVVIAGMKDGADAGGVLDEAQIALDLGRIVIPLAATGWAAAKLWKQLEESRPTKISKSDWKKLKTANDASTFVRSLEDILKKLKI